MSILQLHFSHSNRPPIELSSQEEVIMGRAPTCDVQLSSYDTVSRKHVRVFYQDGHFVVDDLNSTNGTSVNGYPVAGGPVRILRDGDTVQIANESQLMFVVRITEPDDSEDTKPIPTDPMWLLLLEELQQYRDVMLLGVAGIGKTTRLRKLVPESRTQHVFDKFWPANHSFLFCRLDGMAVGDGKLNTFFQLLLTTTRSGFEIWPPEIQAGYEQLSSGNCSVQDIREILITTVRLIREQLGKQVVFLLDHFDDVYPTLPPELFWILKEVKTVEPHTLYVIAMRNEFDGSNSYIHQFLRAIHPPNYHWLPPMRPEKLKSIIRPYRLSKEKEQLSIKFGGQQPRLTDLVANALQHMTTIPHLPTHLTRLLLTNNLVQDHCREIWENLSRPEQKALQSVIKGKATMPYRVERLLTDKKALLVGEGNTLKLENPLFASYIQARQSAIASSSSSQRSTPLKSGSFPAVSKNPTVRTPSGEEIKTGGQPILRAHLTELEEKLLTYIYGRAGEVCSHDEILQHIWGYDADDPASQASISNLVRNLRKKLDKISPGAGKRCIQNVRGRGYIYVKNK